MRRLILVLAAALAALMLSVTFAQAQTPATVHATWTANPNGDNVVQYLVTLDAATPVVTLATACNITCTQILIVPAFGLHTVSIVAQNLKFVGDPTSLQSGPAASATFTLGAVPAVVAGLRVGN